MAALALRMPPGVFVWNGRPRVRPGAGEDGGGPGAVGARRAGWGLSGGQSPGPIGWRREPEAKGGGVRLGGWVIGERLPGLAR